MINSAIEVSDTVIRKTQFLDGIFNENEEHLVVSICADGDLVIEPEQHDCHFWTASKFDIVRKRSKFSGVDLKILSADQLDSLNYFIENEYIARAKKG